MQNKHKFDIMNDLSPICLFVYNRIDETSQTINALKANFLAKKSDLIIYSDGFKNFSDKALVLKIRSYLKEISGFKSIIIRESDINKGLARSVIDGVTEVLNSHDSIIVLEDDLITTPNFLDFMNQGLQTYSLTNNLMSINGFSIDVEEGNILEKKDVFFHNRPLSWGWATWKNRWKKEMFDVDKINLEINNDILLSFKKKCGDDISRMLLDSLSGNNDSWYVRWAFRHFLENKISLFPFYSKVKNIGYGEYATHCKTIDVLKTSYDNEFLQFFNFPEKPETDPLINKRFLSYFSYNYKFWFRISLIFKSKGLAMLFKDVKLKLFRSN
jgi:hypothetical protein